MNQLLQERTESSLDWQLSFNQTAKAQSQHFKLDASLRRVSIRGARAGVGVGREGGGWGVLLALAFPSPPESGRSPFLAKPPASATRFTPESQHTEETGALAVGARTSNAGGKESQHASIATNTPTPVRPGHSELAS